MSAASPCVDLLTSLICVFFSLFVALVGNLITTHFSQRLWDRDATLLSYGCVDRPNLSLDY